MRIGLYGIKAFMHPKLFLTFKPRHSNMQSYLSILKFFVKINIIFILFSRKKVYYKHTFLICRKTNTLFLPFFCKWFGKGKKNPVFSCKHNKPVICCRQMHCMGCGGPELIRLPQHQPGAAIFRISKGQKREISLFTLYIRK